MRPNARAVAVTAKTNDCDDNKPAVEDGESPSPVTISNLTIVCLFGSICAFFQMNETKTEPVNSEVI